MTKFFKEITINEFSSYLNKLAKGGGGGGGGKTPTFGGGGGYQKFYWGNFFTR